MISPLPSAARGPLLVAWLLLCAAYIVVCGRFGGPGTPFDEAVIRAAGTWRLAHGWATVPAEVLTHIGSWAGTSGVGVLVGLWLWVRRGARHGLLMLGAVGAERLAMDGLKLLVARPRPALFEHPVATHSYSFPSGHAANTMTVFVLIALMIAPCHHRRPAVLAMIVLAALIGMSRPFLGVHWPSDMIGGWALAAMMLLLTLRVGEALGISDARSEA